MSRTHYRTVAFLNSSKKVSEFQGFRVSGFQGSREANMRGVHAVLRVAIAIFMLAFSIFAEDAKSAAAEEGFVPLFNGKDLTGWEGDAKLWAAENGEIVGKSPGIKHNEFLASTENYGDFVLKFKFKVVNNPKGDANSGMQFRSQRVPNSTEMSGYQADVGQGYWGCLYDESRRDKVLAKPSPEVLKQAAHFDDWNEYTIACKGGHITLELNGVMTVDYIETEPAEKAAREGKFGLQIHAGGPMEVHMKDVRIKVLGK
jgi:hypothetical protein